MKVILFTAVSAMSLITATSAYADDDGWYLRGNAGYGVHQDAELTGGIDSSQHGNGLQSEGNVAYSLGAGYDFGENWRLELDADSLDSSFGSISQTPGSVGSLKTESLMLNALYDFNDFGKFEPYVGAGLGLVRGNADFAAHDFPSVDNVLTRNPTCIGERTAFQSSSCAISTSDEGFGWQLLAGLGYNVTENLTWDTHYTYLNGPDLDLDGHIANSVTNESSNFIAELDDVGAHTVMTGLRYRFGGAAAAPAIIPAIVPPAPAPKVIATADYPCWDGTLVFNAGECSIQPAPEPTPVVVETPISYCWDGTATYDLASCPVQPAPVVVQQPSLNACGTSPVGIFNVDVNSTPKQMSRLGTLPEFGDSHGLSANQFYEKLNARYSASATDKAYLNYLFKSMGYSNGWADAQPYMFSEDVLPVGTRGLLGLGEQHHYNYSILPSNDRDRQAFKIQSANGVVVHFMKTCGNYFYGCE